MKKTLIVYYSFEGNTRFISEEIQKVTGGDFLELKPVQEIESKGFSKFIWGGKQVMSGETPALYPLDKSVEDYDRIFIGTPVWAWSYAPALESFFKEVSIKNKEVALFCCSGGGPGSTIEKMEKKLAGGENQIIGTIKFRDPLRRDPEVNKKKLQEWLVTLPE